MSQETQVEESINSLNIFKCAKCRSCLKDPVQLNECLHILCKKCVQVVESVSTESNVLKCPLCGKENAKPSSHQSDYNSPGQSMSSCVIAFNEAARECINFFNQPDAENDICKTKEHKDNEKNYFCLQCWKPICGDCSLKGEHKDHKTKDMVHMKEHINGIWDALKQRLSMLQAKTECDKEYQMEMECSLKKHVDSVSKEIANRRCKILKEVNTFFNKAVRDAETQGKGILRDYSREIHRTNGIRSCLESFSNALDTAFKQVNESDYTAGYATFFDKLQAAEGVIDKIEMGVEQDELTAENWKGVMNRSSPEEHRLVICAFDMFRPCQQSVASVTKECQQPPLAFSFKMSSDISRVYSIVVKGSDQCFLSCKLTQDWDRHRADEDNAIVLYRGKTSSPEEKMIRLKPAGRYYISQMATGEIVASYSRSSGTNYADSSSSGTKYAVKYFESDESLFKQEVPAHFKDIYKFDLEPRGITVTKQNTILLVTAGAVRDKKGYATNTVPSENPGYEAKHGAAHSDTSFLILLSLQGKFLTEAPHIVPVAQRPNPGREGDEEVKDFTYVAVSDSGEICLSDPQNGTIAIFDSKLRPKESVKFPHPTSLSKDVLKYVSDGKASTDPAITFRPEGVCYDRNGHIIVADSNNHMVVRLSRSMSGDTYEMKPLIIRKEDSDFKHFRSPKLVTLGEDGQLWVVCQEYVFVFRYGI